MDFSVVEPVRLVPSSYIFPDVIGIAQTANCIPNTHNFDGDILPGVLIPPVARTFVEIPISALDLDRVLLRFVVVGEYFLHPKALLNLIRGFDGFVVRVHFPELGHRAWLADTNTANETSAGAHCVCTTREAEKEKLIARAVVVCKEVVCLAHILVQTRSSQTCCALASM